MLFCENTLPIFDRAIACIDALSAVAVVLIVAFVCFICVRDRKRNNKKK